MSVFDWHRGRTHAGYQLPPSFAGALGAHRLVEALKHAFALRQALGDPGTCPGTCFLNVTSMLDDMLSSAFAASLRCCVQHAHLAPAPAACHDAFSSSGLLPVAASFLCLSTAAESCCIVVPFTVSLDVCLLMEDGSETQREISVFQLSDNCCRNATNDAATSTPGVYGGRWHVDAAAPDDHGTSHFSVVDSQQGAVAMTTTVNTGFGSKLLSPSTGRPQHVVPSPCL